ncbi:MAG: TonB-dependent receptor [Betaproteobacteria bacterium]|jgi:iron complex outermembrane receptor protein
MNPRLTPLAAALSFAFLTPAQADSSVSLDPVLVTATRFSESELHVPANISVISRDDIRTSASRDLPGILRSNAGIVVRSLSGSLGIDSTIDIRGFGESAGSNTLILLDGQRLNPIDAGSVNWSAIPLDSVERIEILRGAGTVQYGDKATGGVVNIITDKSGKPRFGATLGLGSYGTQTIDVNGAAGNEVGYINAFAHYANTNGWRENNQADQLSLSGRGGIYLGKGEGFLDYALYKDSAGLPGYLLSADYPSRPQKSNFPKDTQRSDGYRLRPGVTLPLTDTLRLDAEVAIERQESHYDYVSFASQSDRTRENWSFTPRLRWQHGLGSLASESVFGIDYYSGKVDATYSAAPDQRAEQDSAGAYFQNVTAFGAGWSGLLGFRYQSMDQSASQDAYPAWFQPAVDGDQRNSETAWDIGANYAGSGWRAYAKAGSTFRFPNTDELFGFDPINFVPVFAGNLKPQTGYVQEVGGSATLGPVKTRAAVYHMTLEDEIAYDGMQFANVNLEPTRRQGVELEANWQIVRSLSALLSYAYTESTFRNGVNSGNQLPLVPHNTAAAKISWDAGMIGRYTLVGNYVGNRYYSGDFANSRDKLAGYTTFDLTAGWDFKPWSIAARLLNAFDKVYAPFAGYSAFQGYYYYPADGRTFLMTASYAFR